MKNRLKSKYPNYKSNYTDGECILEDRVFNLITKACYWGKPTYRSMRNALVSMKEICNKHDCKKVAMPVIGCGLDKLEWSKVSEIIKEVFEDTDIEILVCKL